MVNCFAPGCNHRNERDSCKMFRFPKSPHKKRRWKVLVRRKDRSPGKGSRLCSCHFADGFRENLPSIFPWNAAKKTLFASPEKKKRGHPYMKPRSQVQETEPESGLFVLSPIAELGEFESDLPEEEMEIDTQNKNMGTNICDEQGLDHSPGASSFQRDSTEREDHETAELGEQLNQAAAEHRSSPPLFECSSVGLSPSPPSVTFQNSPTQTSAASEKRLAELEEQVKILQRQNEDLRLHRTSAVIAEAEYTLHLARAEKLEAEIARLKSPEGHPVFLFSWVSHKDTLVSHYTGLPNTETFLAILGMFDGVQMKYFKGWKVVRLSPTEQLFLTLMKLRRGFSFDDLSVRMGVDATTVSNVFHTWLIALHKVIFQGLMKSVPSRFKNKKYLPKEFKEKYGKTRIVLDCTEVTAAYPKLISHQNQLYSSYKHKITLKGLVGVSPNGVVTFASRLYPGRFSDKEIVNHSKVLDICEEGDLIMADKGFLILPLLPKGVTLNIPPFKNTPQFTPEQIAETTSTARARIHVERAIQRIKLFKVLDFIPQYARPYASEIFQVCAALTNFRKPLIRDIIEDE